MNFTPGFITDANNNKLSSITSSRTVFMDNGQSVYNILDAIKAFTGVQNSIGEIFWWPLDTPPSDSLHCDGRAVNITEFADLYSVISTTFGAGNGSTTFNLPDLRGKIDNLLPCIKYKIKDMPWIYGYFQNRSVSANAWIPLSPQYNSGKGITISGDHWIAPVTGIYTFSCNTVLSSTSDHMSYFNLWKNSLSWISGGPNPNWITTFPYNSYSTDSGPSETIGGTYSFKLDANDKLYFTFLSSHSHTNLVHHGIQFIYFLYCNLIDQ